MSRVRLSYAKRAVLAAAALIASLVSVTAHAAPAMWRVTGASSEIYLFGTLHALDPATRWRTPAYDAAYEKAGVVWFEADLGRADPASMALILNQYGVDPDKGLSEKLAPADLAALKGQADLARIDHLRPWAAAMMLSMQPVISGGASVQAGADASVTRAARAGGKQIKVFETLEDQARMFAGLSEPAEVAYLSDVIRQRARPAQKLSLRPATASSLEAEWLAGDLAKLGPGLVRDMGHDNPGLYEALLKNRNLAWADTLTQELGQAQGVELVNVGALHLVGADGLPALLKARGFKVERVQ
ncbi:MAG: TraB/GumN family protein [Phenylobacterium sp.]